MPPTKSESFAETLKVAGPKPAPVHPIARPKFGEYSQERQPTFGFTDEEGPNGKEPKPVPVEVSQLKEAKEDMSNKNNNGAPPQEPLENPGDVKTEMDKKKILKQQEGINDSSKPSTPPPTSPVKPSPLVTSQGENIQLSAIPMEDDETAVAPPKSELSLSRGAIDKRMRRVFTPRTNGTFKVPAKFVQEYQKKGSARKSLEKILASCGYCVD